LSTYSTLNELNHANVTSPEMISYFERLSTHPSKKFYLTMSLKKSDELSLGQINKISYKQPNTLPIFNIDSMPQVIIRFTYGI
jgi:hypothetical protein